MPTTATTDRASQNTSRSRDDGAIQGASGGARDGGAAGRAGDAAVRRMAQSPATSGVPGIDNPEKLAQESLFSADASVTAAEGEEIYHEGHVRVRFDPGTRFSVRLDPGGLTLRADPGLVVDVPGPNLRLTSVSYDFQTASFHAAGHASFDILGAYSHIAMGVAERALEKKLKPLLPERLKKPGYSTQSDPDLQGTMAALSGAFQFTRGDAGSPQMTKMPRLVDPSAFAVLQAPRDLHVPLGTESLELFLAAGTLIDVGMDAGGPVDKPKLKQLNVTSSGPGIEIQSTGKGIADVFKGLTMKRITITPGGHFDFDYDLRPEEMGQGLLALAALLDMAAGHQPGEIPDVKMKGVRKELDARLQAEVPARFKAFLAQFDHALPGLSLLDIFGER